ncbi:MAG: flagellar basal body L-ring protein FlgH [Desulfobacteraceae bacterium]|nr:flagellar basal body L-ring protein FlgH [Desulfobacteraceae bacterium]
MLNRLRIIKLIAGASYMGIWMCGWGCGGLMYDQAKKDAQTPYAQQPAMSGQAETPFKTVALAQVSEGSLWQDNSPLSSMFINVKARRTGDIITVKIVESSSASNTASTSTDRSSALTGGITNFFNMEQSYPSDRPFFNPFSGVAASLDSEFEGSGATIRSGDLTAYLTARIVEVLENGNLVIQGTREVRINHENQIITLTGLVRPRDISADNVVQSTYIADAKISYSGSGVINDRQRPGWLMRFFDKVWPF